MRFKHLDLIIIMLVVAINVGLTQLPTHFLLVGIIFALPLILFLPGYALTQTLFRKRAEGQALDSSTNRTERADLKLGHPIGSVDQIVLSLGLSMALDVLIGFMLNILPIGLTALSWTLSLSLVTTVFVVCATFLRRKDILSTSKTPKIRVTLQDCILFSLAILIVTAAVLLSFNRPIQPQPSFTQLWMLPTNQADKTTCGVSVGIQSFETTSQSYRLVITVNGTQTNTWPSIALAPQEKWTQSVSVKPDTSSSIRVEALLYRLDKSDAVYRNVHVAFYISSVNINGTLQQQCLSETKS